VAKLTLGREEGRTPGVYQGSKLSSCRRRVQHGNIKVDLNQDQSHDSCRTSSGFNVGSTYGQTSRSPSYERYRHAMILFIQAVAWSVLQWSELRFRCCWVFGQERVIDRCVAIGVSSFLKRVRVQCVFSLNTNTILYLHRYQPCSFPRLILHNVVACHVFQCPRCLFPWHCSI
jgi:hypothetical protein